MRGEFGLLSRISSNRINLNAVERLFYRRDCCTDWFGVISSDSARPAYLVRHHSCLPLPAVYTQGPSHLPVYIPSTPFPKLTNISVGTRIPRCHVTCLTPHRLSAPDSSSIFPRDICTHHRRQITPCRR